jgi:transposase InsO family protein
MAHYAARFVKNCVTCAHARRRGEGRTGFLKPLSVPFKPWTDITIDYVTGLPGSRYRGQQYKHILVVVDRLTKMRHLVPMVSMETKELVDAFVDRVYRLHGLPSTIVSGRGTQLISTFWRQLQTRLGVETKPSSAYHPQTNGQSEIINAIMKTFLRKYVNWAQDDWAQWLPLAEFTANNSPSETTGLTPFFANYGWHPRMGTEPGGPRPPEMTPQQLREYEAANFYTDRLQARLYHVWAAMRAAQNRYELIANRDRQPAPVYREGDEVFVSMENMAAAGRPSESLSAKWAGPYKVLKVYDHTVIVDFPESSRVSPIFHDSKVKLAPGDAVPG